VSAKKQEMNKQFDDIKTKLLERKKELEEMLTTLAQDKITDDQVQDLGDQVSSATLETLRNSLETTEIEEYNRLLGALDALNKGTYGICIDCEQPIAEKRLSVYPNASRCLACQEASEGR